MPLNPFEMARAALLDLVATKLPDNDTEQITPASLRAVLVSMVHSMFVKLTDILAGPNLRPDLRKAIRWYSEQTTGYDGDGPTLADIPPATMCLATTIRCDFGPDGTGKEYALVYDEAGPLEVWRDATFTGQKIKAKVVLMGSEEQQFAGLQPWNPFGTYDGPNEQGNFASQVTHQGRIWTADYPMKPEDYGPAGVPEPGTPDGGLLWSELSPTPVTHQQNTDTGTKQPEFTLGLGSSSQATTEYRLLKFMSDSQRKLVALAVRWLPQPDGNDVVELVRCMDYYPPATRGGNVWEALGSGGGIDGLYIEDGVTLVVEAGGQQRSLDLAPAIASQLGNAAATWVLVDPAATHPGQVGSFAQPFATLDAAQYAVPVGGRVLLAPGTYGAFTWTKAVTIAALVPGTVTVTNWTYEVAGAVTTRDVRFVTRTTLNHNFGSNPAGTHMHWQAIDCEFGPTAQLYKSNTGNYIDNVYATLVRCRGAYSGSEALFRYQENPGYPQLSYTVLEDCVFSSTTALFTGALCQLTEAGTTYYSTVTLRGTTRLAAPTLQQFKRSGIALTDTQVFVDERPASGPVRFTTRYDLTTRNNFRSSDMVFEEKVVLSALKLGTNAASIAGQVLDAASNAAAPSRTGSVGQVVAAINADIAALPDPSYYTVRFITTPVTAADVAHVLVTVTAAS